MQSPYFNTHLYADIRLRPSQMNNNLIEELKQNLNQKLCSKCYKNYGYIDAIYDIDNDIKGGYIRAEDNTASSIHKIKFGCRIINPIIKGNLIAKIIGINNKVIIASDGPVVIMIGAKNINSNNIVYHNTAYYPLNESGKIINNPIVKDSYVKIKIFNKQVINGRDKILAFGTIESVASDDEVKKYMTLKYPDKETDPEDIINMKAEPELTDIKINSESDTKTNTKKIEKNKNKKDLETESVSSELSELSDMSDLSDE